MASETEADWIRAARICRDVAELPDRTSPDENADFMLVKGDELQPMLAAEFAEMRVEQAAELSRLRAECERLALEAASYIMSVNSLRELLQRAEAENAGYHEKWQQDQLRIAGLEAENARLEAIAKACEAYVTRPGGEFYDDVVEAARRHSDLYCAMKGALAGAGKNTLKPSMTKLEAENARLRAALETVRSELAALAPNPANPDWTTALTSGQHADGVCLTTAYNAARAALMRREP
jgi:hypothetical protein